MRWGEAKNLIDGVDGVDGLRRRERTRLWYRALPPVDVLPDRWRETAGAVDPDAVPASEPGAAASPGSDALEDFFLARRSAVTSESVAGTPRAADPVAALTGWQTVPADAPTLLLSASRLLEGRARGPILGPGRRYRIVDVEDGVVGLVVVGANGATMPGYCNASDLSCVAPLVADLLAKGTWGRSQTTARRRVARLSQGIGTIAGSFLHGPAGADSRLP